jgi:hypothetical protein
LSIDCTVYISLSINYVLNFETSYFDKKQFVKNVSEDEDGRHSRSTIYGSKIDCFTFYWLHAYSRNLSLQLYFCLTPICYVRTYLLFTFSPHFGMLYSWIYILSILMLPLSSKATGKQAHGIIYIYETNESKLAGG